MVGYPENGPLAIAPARLGSTGGATTEDSYGNGPLRRSLTALRGEVLSGNSGGPVIDGSGQVLTTVFASTDSKQPGGYGVPERGRQQRRRKLWRARSTPGPARADWANYHW